MFYVQINEQTGEPMGRPTPIAADSFTAVERHLKRHGYRVEVNRGTVIVTQVNAVNGVVLEFARTPEEFRYARTARNADKPTKTQRRREERKFAKTKHNKLPWQMTREEWWGEWNKTFDSRFYSDASSTRYATLRRRFLAMELNPAKVDHEQVIRYCLSLCLPVPDAIVAEYPQLLQEAGSKGRNGA